MLYHHTRENGAEKSVHMFEFGDQELRILYDLVSHAQIMTPVCLETQVFRARLKNMSNGMSEVIGKRLRIPSYHSKEARVARQNAKAKFAREMGLVPGDLTTIGGLTKWGREHSKCPLERIGKECDPQDEACIGHLGDEDRSKMLPAITDSVFLPPPIDPEIIRKGG